MSIAIAVTYTLISADHQASLCRHQCAARAGSVETRDCWGVAGADVERARRVFRFGSKHLLLLLLLLHCRAQTFLVASDGPCQSAGVECEASWYNRWYGDESGVYPGGFDTHHLYGLIICM